MGDFVFTLKKDINKINKLHASRKFLILALFAFLFGISVFIGAIFISNSGQINQSSLSDTGVTQNNDTEESDNFNASTTLNIDPPNAFLSLNEPTLISVMLEGEPVTAIDIALIFDPDVLEISQIENGDIFTRIIRNEIKDNQIIYSATISPESPKDISTGRILSFIAIPKRKIDLETSIAFDKDQTITALEGRNTLKDVQGALYKIN